MNQFANQFTDSITGGIAGVALMTAALLTGCSTPSHTARFQLSGGQTMALKVEGQSPTVQLIPKFGPLKSVEWVRPDGVTRFDGVPAGGDMVLTVHEHDVVRFTDQLGTSMIVKMWNATGYTLENVEPGEVAAR
jgi:hypothetical protein